MVAKRIGGPFVACLGLSPLLFGANVPLAWGLDAAAFGVLLAFHGAGRLIEGEPFPAGAGRLAIPLTAIGLVLLWVFLQTQSWTPEALHHPLWARAREALGQPLDGAISIDPSETRLALVRLATAAAVFALALQLGRDPAWAARIVWTVAIAGAVYAVYAMALKAAGDDARLALPASLFQLEQSPAFAGPFVNRNHFAIYLGLGAVACWALFSRDMRRGTRDQGFAGGRELAARGLGAGRAIGRHALLSMPLLAGLLLTSSRAGFFLTMAGILVMAAVEGARARPARMGAWAALAAAAAGVGVALAAQGDLLGGRLAGSQVSDIGSRVATSSIAVQAILDRPLLGHGYGTFSSVFPMFRDGQLPLGGRWEEAHNSYLEAALGLGAPVALIFFAALGWLVYRCARGAAARKRDRLAPSAALGATMLVGLHSCVDFSIQIQGVALTYAALLGAGYAQSWSSREV